MPTLCGSAAQITRERPHPRHRSHVPLPPSRLRRRGVTPEAIRLFIERTGVSKAENNIEYSVLEDCVRTVRRRARQPAKAAPIHGLHMAGARPRGAAGDGGAPPTACDGDVMA